MAEKKVTFTEETVAPSTDILETLIVLGRGTFTIECGRNLKEVIDAISATHLPGKLKITLAITPAGLDTHGRVNQIETARDLTAKTDVNFESKVTPRNGQVSIRYTEQIDAKIGPAGTLEVPEVFKLSIPVFYGEERITIEARLRFRIQNQKLFFFYKLYRPVEVISEAFNRARRSMEETLKVSILLGTPGL